MRAYRAEFPIAAMCRVLGLSTSGYYDWLKRPLSTRSREDARLRRRMRAIWEESRRTYGRPRMVEALRAEGEFAGERRVARLMRLEGIRGVGGAKRRSSARRGGRRERVAPDLAERNFSVDGPNRLWVADITQARTRAGWLYLAVVVDAWSRRVVGWSTGKRPKGSLATEALSMAVQARRPKPGVVHHSDQGSQYTSLEFGERCREAGVKRSVGSVGDAYDNAMCESFFATLKRELISRRRFRTRREARREIFDYIEGLYSTRRLHSSLGYASPVEYEARGGAGASSGRVEKPVAEAA